MGKDAFQPRTSPFDVVEEAALRTRFAAPDGDLAFDGENPTALKSIVDVNANGVIAEPLRLAGVPTQFALARCGHGYEGRLDAKIRKLEDTMKGRRVVEKATRVLMGSTRRQPIA